MNRMLINATQHEELRVALVNGQALYDLDIERPGREQKIANIYKGEITRIEPSLEAAFVNYGANRHGFLPLKEIAEAYYSKQPDPNTRESIADLIKVGQQVIIQVDKEERGNKGAALTTYISLAGSYLVLMPNNPSAGGISRRIEGNERDELREVLNQLKLPEEMGLIVRTAGVGCSVEELQWDLDLLLKHWQAIQAAANERPAPFLIHQESNVIMRSLRDYLRMDIGEIIIDNQSVYEKARSHMAIIRPDFVEKIKYYDEAIPLFHRFQIESQIESAFQRNVTLPSGGSIVIDHTEALVTIDINSSRATKGSDIEETALNTNLEAADEIARQLRLRDLGGLIVIDFIDMIPVRNQREVEYRLRDALRMDRARVQIGRISRFGLLEMSRQRLRPSLEEASQVICPRCSGYGHIRGVESLSLSILRLIRENAMKENSGQVRVQVPVSVATFLTNEKRGHLLQTQQEYGVDIFIIANPNLETPHYAIDRLREDDPRLRQPTKSHAIELDKPVDAEQERKANLTSSETPAIDITQLTPAAPKPSNTKKVKKVGWLTKLLQFLMGGASESKNQQPRYNRNNQNRRHQSDSRRRHHSGGQSRNRQQHSKRRHHNSSSHQPQAANYQDNNAGKYDNGNGQQPHTDQSSQNYVDQTGDQSSNTERNSNRYSDNNRRRGQRRRRRHPARNKQQNYYDKDSNNSGSEMATSNSDHRQED